jgi:protein-L-isoaspartate(D-aspartate) O-methyltransferase
LQKSGIRNAEVMQADGAQGLAAEGPFDVIVLSGSVAEVPSALLAALKVGGRLAAIVGDEPVMRATFVTRTSEAGYRTAQPWDTLAPRLLNFSEPSRFHF